MLPKAVVLKVAAQLLGVGAYLALVVVLYWRGMTDAGAVAIIVGLLFFFKTLANSGAISIAHLFPWDPRAVARSPLIELSKSVSFLTVGYGLVLDLGQAVRFGLVPHNLVAAAILMTLLFVFIAGGACCFIRFITTMRFWPPR
jgi:hypothetical protein